LCIPDNGIGSNYLQYCTAGEPKFKTELLNAADEPLTVMIDLNERALAAGAGVVHRAAARS
jgi:hypothetical protein